MNSKDLAELTDKLQDVAEVEFDVVSTITINWKDLLGFHHTKQVSVTATARNGYVAVVGEKYCCAFFLKRLVKLYIPVLRALSNFGTAIENEKDTLFIKEEKE